MSVARKLASIGLCAAGLTFAAPARADEWYGWQTLTSDAATLVVTAVVASTTKGAAPPALAAVAGYVAAPVVIHAVHEEPLNALASGGVRVALPLGGSLAGASLGSRRGDFTGLTTVAGAVLGLFAGAIVASVIDAAAIAWERE
jgi:hypothetical protein